ncbi:MAG: iron-sulfur cluster assembly scaffold protein [Candidatus Pacearchaeota archaeon]|nr:iron-sulfur cluster assembly scaffold protein [Candidatus Pacearchaeota archaeon]
MEQGIPETLYSKHILELYKNPSNFGMLKNPTHSRTEYNSICGDEITVQLEVKNGIAKDVKFSGSGCVLSLVSASLLTSKIKGMKTEAIKKMNKDDIKELFKTKINNSRIKCVLLPLEAVKKALK